MASSPLWYEPRGVRRSWLAEVGNGAVKWRLVWRIEPRSSRRLFKCPITGPHPQPGGGAGRMPAGVDVEAGGQNQVVSILGLDKPLMCTPLI